MFSLILRYKMASGIIALLIISFISWQVLNKPATQLRTATVMRGDVVQEVSATGRIKAADTVNLAFEKSGRITSLPVKEGVHVAAGALLVQLDSQELLAQRLRESATVQSAQVKLDQLLSGARPEDIYTAEVAVSNAQIILDETLLKDAIDTARSGINSAISAMVPATTIQFTYTYTPTGEQYGLANKKELAMQAIYWRTGLGGAQTWVFLPMQEGLKTKLASIEASPLTADQKLFLREIKNALTLTKDVLDAAYGIATSAGATDTEKTAVTTARTDVLSKIATVTTQEQAIVAAENSLKAAQATLALKKAPATQYDVDIAKANLIQAQANLNLIDAQLAKQSLRSPISGVVAKIVARRGEIVSPNTPVISVISDAKFQIEASIPEADIAKVKIGNSARVTLDAYSQDILFPAHIISIDPGEVLVEGVATYKVTFEFDKDDDRILSGLTANIDVLSSRRDDVLYVPTRDITTREGKKYITVLDNPTSQETREVEVRAGLKGSDGRTEIISGTSEGEIIVE